MTSDREITLQLDYPQNLILAVVQNSDLIPPKKFTDDICAGIRYVISTLGYREQDILRMRFEERKSRSEIGEFFGIGQERVRQIENKTLRSLRASTRWNYMKLGIDGYMRWVKERAYGEGYKTGYEQGYKDGYSDGQNGVEQPSISEELLNHPIDSLGLSVRAYNCLLRAGCERVGDAVRLSEDQIQRIRNLGAKTANEIACAIRDLGIPNTSWSTYILQIEDKEIIYMLKVDINKDGSKPVVHASGNIMEILNDIAIMTSALYTQFQAADATTAHYFRTGFINMTNDPDSPMWKALGNQNGIAYRK